MKKSAVVFLTLVVAGALLLTACESPIWSISDTEVTFDSSGHMTKDVTYTDYDSFSSSFTQTYSADGTYEDIIEGWDAPSSTWKQSDGEKGTYSYNASTRTLTTNFTQTWNGGIGGSYVTLTSGSTHAKTSICNMLFGFTNVYGVMVGDSGTYIYSEDVKNWDGTSYTYAYSISVPSDLSTYTTTLVEVDYDATGMATSTSRKSSTLYTVGAIFPSTVTSIDNAKGQTLTLDYLKYVDTPYTWTSGTNFTAGTATTLIDPGSRTVSLANDGSYLIYPTIAIARHMASK